MKTGDGLRIFTSSPVWSSSRWLSALHSVDYEGGDSLSNGPSWDPRRRDTPSGRGNGSSSIHYSQDGIDPIQTKHTTAYIQTCIVHLSVFCVRAFAHAQFWEMRRSAAGAGRTSGADAAALAGAGGERKSAAFHDEASLRIQFWWVFIVIILTLIHVTQ